MHARVDPDDTYPRAAPAPTGAAATPAHLEALGRRIRGLRERLGLTQEDFAQRSGISVSFASLLERGERSPSYETLLQVAAALDVPLGELLQEEEDTAGAWRLHALARERGLSRAQVDQLLAVAHALFTSAPGAGAEDATAPLQPPPSPFQLLLPRLCPTARRRRCSQRRARARVRRLR